MSKAVREGMHLVNEAQDFTERMQDVPKTGDADTTTQAQGGAIATQFGRKFDARTPYDDDINMRMQLMDKNGMTPFGQVYYDDRVARWMEKKAAVQETANLDKWFNAEYNKNNLADRQFAQQIYPEFYAERERQMLAKAKEALAIKMIQLRGPQSKEDLYKQWLINTGRVVLPPDWDRIGPSATQVNMEKETALFRSQLIRLPKFVNTNVREDHATQNQRVGLWGNQAAAQRSANPFGWEQGEQLISRAQSRPLAEPRPGLNTTATDILSQLRTSTL